MAYYCDYPRCQPLAHDLNSLVLRRQRVVHTAGGGRAGSLSCRGQHNFLAVSPLLETRRATTSPFGSVSIAKSSATCRLVFGFASTVAAILRETKFSFGGDSPATVCVCRKDGGNDRKGIWLTIYPNSLLQQPFPFRSEAAVQPRHPRHPPCPPPP